MRPLLLDRSRNDVDGCAENDIGDWDLERRLAEGEVVGVEKESIEGLGFEWVWLCSAKAVRRERRRE
jgi:hypothetical protein